VATNAYIYIPIYAPESKPRTTTQRTVEATKPTIDQNQQENRSISTGRWERAMAAAVLGHAARRLGGSGALRQTQESAVSSAVKRRFAHTEVQHPCTCGKFERDAVLNGIQKQKENLYDAMTAASKKYGKDTDRATPQNNSLLRDLSKQVKPRSGDPTWYDPRSADQIKLTNNLRIFLLSYPYVF
jgi:hypothetical protein